MSNDSLLSRAVQDPDRFGGGFWNWLQDVRRGADLTTLPGSADSLTPEANVARIALPALYPRTAGISALGSMDYRAHLLAGGAGRVAAALNAGEGLGDARFLLAGTLPPPSHLMDFGADALPTPAEVSNASELLGEQGGQGPMNPLRMFDAARIRALTTPESLAPGNMGLDDPARDPNAHAVATTHAPDYGVEAAAGERMRQLPSRQAFRAGIQGEAAPADAAQIQTAAQGSLPPPKRPRPAAPTSAPLPPGGSNAQAVLQQPAPPLPPG